MNIKYRIATLNDFDEIYELFRKATDNMNENRIYQWDEIYPNRAILKDDIKKQQLHIGISNEKIAVAFVLNVDSDEAYKECKWEYPNSRYVILHRFCVNPEFQNRGLGSEAMKYIENIVREIGFESIRLDAFSENPYALQMYKKLCYKTVGFADFRKGRFHLMEKKL